MVKQSYDDPVKEKWRHAWFKFIKKNKGFLGGNPREMTGVFFPGEDALELKVYDKLGIPRENLVGLEYDVEYYEKLKKKKLGIRMTDEPMDALDFFKETDEKFSFVNLDYTGQLNTKVVNTIRDIAGRQALKENSLFGLTVYGKREGDYVKEIYRGAILGEVSEDRVLSFFQKERGLFQEKYIETRNRVENQNQKKSKDEGLTQMVKGTFSNGTANIKIPEIFKRDPLFDYTINKAKEYAIQENILFDSDFDIFSLAEVSASLQAHLMCHLIDTGFANNPQDAVFPTIQALSAEIKPYFLKTIEKYKYTSRNGAAMISDFFGFSQHRNLFEKHNYLAKNSYLNLDHAEAALSLLDENERPTGMGEIRKLYKKTAKEFDLIDNLIKRQTEKENAPRIDLGSSAKLLKLTGREYYKERFFDHKNGIPIEKTRERLRKIFNSTPGQLSSLEAHYTMETHGKRYKDEVKTPNKGLENIVNINRNQLINSRNFGRLPENWKKRVEYFVGDDLVRLNLNQEDANYLAAEIKSVKWFDKFSDGKISDSQFYGFFDNLMLKSIAGKKLKRGDIESIAKGVMSGGWKRVGIDFNKSKPILTCEKYIELSGQGRDDGWILDNYKTNKPNSIGAYKAWDTMRKGEEKGERNTGHDVISMLREGGSKKEVMEKFDIDKMQLAGYLAANRRGSYRHLFGNESPSLYVDSRGVVHRNSDISDIEKGYK
jgi:hypothetical protein